MRKLFSSRAGRWFRRPTAVLTLVLSVVAGCGGGDDNSGLFPQSDSGKDSQGTADHSSDTSSDRGSDARAGDSAPEVGETDQAAGDEDGARGSDVSSTDAADASLTDADAAGPGDARTDGDAKLDAPVDAPAPVCTDQVKNGTETDIDCGGTCAPTSKCGDGKGCSVAGDCQSGVCTSSHVCGVPSCSDTVKNGTETDVDCGGAACLPNKKCGDGKGCSVAGDCQSGVCTSSHVCGVPSCSDTVKNGTETDVDCGGSCSGTSKCANGKGCSVGGDCQSGICKSNVCIAPSCTNLVKDTNETAVDCGGPDCAPCTDGLACALNRDCTSGKCTNLVCTAPSCADQVKNGNETDVDCGGSCATKCALTKLCGQDSDCQSGHCPSGACVECIVATTCPGQDTECQTRACTAHVCGFSFIAANTAVPTQTPGDCHTRRCNGSGAITNAVDDADVPVDNNQCTDNVCTAGTPSNPLLPARTACTQNNGALCTSNGLCVACLAPADCPGVDNECEARTCNSNTCGFSYTTVGTPANTQTAGDCHTNRCSGATGTNAITNAVDDSDKPVDGNPCTDDVCMAGVPTNPFVAAGTSCGGGSFCNSMGQCSLMCVVPGDCPGVDNDCQTRTCSGGLCGFDRKMAGTLTPPSTQTTGDCHTRQCDGNGNAVNAVDDTDVPIDNNPCTSDLCAAGAPSNTPVSGLSCSQAPGNHICSAALDGTCVECNVSTDCPGDDTACHARTCVSHICGISNTTDGTPTGSQTSHDCRQNVCSGGDVVAVDDPTDIPADDGNPCTDETCTGSNPATPDHPTAGKAGFACTSAQGGRCDTGGSCIPTFMVFRVGDGSAALTNASTAAFVERRYFDSVGAIVPVPTVTGTLALPTAVNGTQQPLTVSGSASSEGMLSLSADLHYVTLAGYGAAPGMGANGSALCTVGTAGCTSSISNTSTANLNRVVGRIDAAGAIDTSTRLNAAFSANNVRGATSLDGTGFWVTGAGGATAGVQFIALGTTGGAQVEATPASTRAIQIVGGQLYASSNSNPLANVFTVGSGTPQMGPQTATTLSGMSTASGPSPFQFVLLDRDSGVAGVDTLYVADDRAIASGGGIQKYTFNGTAWSLVTTYTDGLATSAGVRGLTGLVTGNSVTLLATTADVTNANKIVMYVDDGNLAPTQTVLTMGTAAVNTVYRGLSIAP